MTQDEAEAIAQWAYDPPYDFYNTAADARDLGELLDPKRRGDRYFAVRDGAGELIGFFEFSRGAGIVRVGLGLRPDLTGRGLGLSFLEEGLEFARRTFRPGRFTLSVAEFNKRAIKVYRRCGFSQTRSFVHETNGGTYRFVEMERQA
jgi:[ribosomal protein S18]-alanine N-acetyltransferase